jgi:hypothetical protein
MIGKALVDYANKLFRIGDASHALELHLSFDAFYRRLMLQATPEPEAKYTLWRPARRTGFLAAKCPIIITVQGCPTIWCVDAGAVTCLAHP